MLICQICKKEILESDKRMFVANDRPFFTFYMHKTCEATYTPEYWFSHLDEFVEAFNAKKSRKITKNKERDYNIGE